jgi:diguanylate cyclase (GGDEF)-like protein
LNLRKLARFSQVQTQLNRQLKTVQPTGPGEQILRLLNDLGVPTTADGGSRDASGFPVVISLANGGSISLDLPAPALLGNLDTKEVGAALVDPLGVVRRTWGVAEEVCHFSSAESLLHTPLTGLLECSGSGKPVSLYLDGYRFYASPVAPPKEKKKAPPSAGDTFILVVNAREEQVARRDADRSKRFAEALKRVGKVLAANQSVEKICLAAVHEIASATDLAAVAIWTPSQEGVQTLTASVGISRNGQATMKEIFPESEASCVAELVGATMRPCFIRNVADHLMTAGLEARLCYLSVGGCFVLPLTIGHRLLGLLELISRQGDVGFEDQRELFETFAEHLALAMNAALLFETAESRAAKDALTGIANHRTMQEFLLRRVAEARRGEHCIGVMMIDVDHFRAFNEEEGHDAGDAVLQQVAETLKACVRPYDLAARYGGEEFTVIMPGSTKEALLEIAERIRARVESQPYASSTGRERHVTVSIGCSAYPEVATEPKELIKAADKALFEAKRAGRNRVIYFTGDLDDLGGPLARHVSDIRPYLEDKIAAESEDLLKRTKDEIDFLSLRLPLSSTQSQILQALVLIAPTYRRAVLSANHVSLVAMESASEFRVLLPSLHALNERYDGTGPGGVSGNRIPLLARVLHVLLALEEYAGEPLMNDPGRFDPEIVSLMGEKRSAA